jgi:hypothetical protein
MVQWLHYVKDIEVAAQSQRLLAGFRERQIVWKAAQHIDQNRDRAHRDALTASASGHHPPSHTAAVH